MQMPTPPMTMAEMERDRHHECDRRHYLAADERLSPTFRDWTLFLGEGNLLDKPSPLSAPMERSAKTPRLQHVRAQRNSKTTKQQQQNENKKGQSTKTKSANRVETQKYESKLSEKDQPTRKETGWPEARGFQVQGFDEMPRILKPSPTFARYPTPPVEEMGEMFAPIEALGEDLRYYASAQTN